jgi:hypothetical protein
VNDQKAKQSSGEQKTGDFKYVIYGGKKSLDQPADQPSANQPPYMFGSTQVEVYLDPTKEYYIVPSVKNRKQPGTYFISVYADQDFELISGAPTALERSPKECKVGSKVLHLSEAQFSEKVEEVRERLQSEAAKLGIGLQDMKRLFKKNEEIPRTTFKRRLVEFGFSLADFPDEDFIVLDEDNNGTINATEFLTFFGTVFEAAEVAPPDPPPDDLVFQPIDIAGQLCVSVVGAKALRKAAAWFDPKEPLDGTTTTPSILSRKKFHYDVSAAQQSRREPVNIKYLRVSSEADALMKSEADALKSEADALRKSALIKESNEERYDREMRLDTNPQSPLKPGERTLLPQISSVNPRDLPQKFFPQDPPLYPPPPPAVRALHADPVLQEKESDRIVMLKNWRERLNKETKDGTNVSERTKGSSILISKHCLKKKRTDHSFSTEIIDFLALPPPPPPDSKSKPSEVLTSPPPPLEVKAVPTLKRSRGRFSGRDYDVWDIIIDRVEVLSSCRSREAIRMNALIGKLTNSYTPLKPSVFEKLDMQSKLSTPIPTPSKTPVVQVATQKGTKSVQASNEIIGTASSMRLSGKSQATLAANNVTNARDVLRNMSKEVAYVEVYRRLIPVPIINFSQVSFPSL